MTMRLFKFFKLAVTALLALPALALAVPATSPYYADTVNSYVQDQVSKDMEGLNNFLCLINAMAPNQLVNEGDYIAMVDLKACSPNTGSSSGGTAGGSSGNNGANYLSVQVNSSRTSNTTPMVTKIWLEDFVVDSMTNATINVPMYTSALQAPSRTAPYGVFRLDYCKIFPSETCDKHTGYINATKDGLAFYTLDYKNGTYGEYYDEFALALTAKSSTNSGSGIVIKTNTNNSSGIPDTSAIVFAHNPDYFYRDDGINTPQCFSRTTNKAEESVWRYGLYDATTGERLLHESGFPIEYTNSSNETHNGYIGYWGLWLPVTVNSGEKVYRISYDNYPPTKDEYTLKRSDGKLTKYSTIFKKLSDLNKIPVWYYPYANVLDNYGGTAMIANNYYEIYWDETVKQFLVYSQYNSTTYNMEKLASPITINNASLVAADIYGMGLSGYSDSVGGQFNIKFDEFATLATSPTPSDIPVITQTQDVVYPKDFVSINALGGLQCITDCPTVTSINAYNSDLALTPPTYNVPSVDFPNYYSPYVYPTLINSSYSLDPLTGNMLEGAPVSGNPSSGAAVKQSTYNSVYSGRLVTADDMVYIQSQKPSGTGITYSAADIDLLANRIDTNGNPISYSYYVWETSSNSYNQMSFLLDETTTPATTVIFYAPLPVSFSVPQTTKYGAAAGSKITLQYSEFGNLWGIPYKCVDLRNNGDCIYSAAITTTATCTTSPTYDPACSTTITPWDKQYWTAQYSIPFGAEGVVTAEISQGDIGTPGYIAKNTQYLVKALDKELRLAQVPVNICDVQGLGQNISIDKLPSVEQWVDPTTKIGTKPLLNPVPAPRVIHGVKQY